MPGRRGRGSVRRDPWEKGRLPERECRGTWGLCPRGGGESPRQAGCSCSQRRSSDGSCSHKCTELFRVPPPQIPMERSCPAVVASAQWALPPVTPPPEVRIPSGERDAASEKGDEMHNLCQGGGAPPICLLRKMLSELRTTGFHSLIGSCFP